MFTQQIDLTDHIERMPQLEQKWKVKLTGLFAAATEEEDYDDEDRVVPTGKFKVTVNGEVEAQSGSTLCQSLDLVVTLHDERGRVLARMSDYLSQDEFFALQAFSSEESGLCTVPTKIRVYPQGS